MLHAIQPFLDRPALYAPGSAKLWEDDHISRGMLEAHLNPELDSATRNHAFVQTSAGWIAWAVPPETHPRLLDLGCGPGLYARRFCAAGYRVTGVDVSRRSIRYAREAARRAGQSITYRLCDYLALDYSGGFDAATLIYCDFGALPARERGLLLRRVHEALRPGGKLVFDVFTPLHFAGQAEGRSWEYAPGGFWSAAPYLCLNSFYRYDEHSTVLRQHLVLTEQSTRCYNVWEHAFTKGELERDLRAAGFAAEAFYGDIAGADFSETGEQMCVIAQRP